MLTADLKHVKTVDEFYTEIRSQQETHHGKDYCAMHDAIRKYLKDCKSYKELGTHQGGTAACVMTAEHKPEYMELVDINHEKYRWKLKSLAEPYCEENNIELVVKDADSTGLNSLSDRDIDMLVIDSLHKRFHMEAELTMHANYIKKYIIDIIDVRITNGLAHLCLTRNIELTRAEIVHSSVGLSFAFAFAFALGLAFALALAFGLESSSDDSSVPSSVFDSSFSFSSFATFFASLLAANLSP